MEDCVLFAYSLDGKGKGEPLAPETVISHLNEQRLAWAHLNAASPKTREWLNSPAVKLDKFVIDALLSEETRPRLLEHEQGLLLILRGVNLNEGAQPNDMVSIRMWIEKHRIISLQRRELKAVSDISSNLEQGKGPRNPSDFIAKLIARLLARMDPALSELDEAMDDLESRMVTNGDFSMREEIINCRMQAIGFRRYLAPQRDAIGQLRTSDHVLIGDLDRRSLQESHNHILRYIEDLDAIRERAQIIKDELASILADKMNKNMYVLSVIAAIFLPLGFFTGLLGVNIGGIPGTTDDMAFLIFCTLLAAIVAAQIVLFKKMKWF